MSLTEREIFKQPLSKQEIEGLLELRPLDEVFSWKSRRLKALELDAEGLSDEEKLDWMTKEPALVRRPMIDVGEELVVGFNAKRLAEIYP